MQRWLRLIWLLAAVTMVSPRAGTAQSLPSSPNPNTEQSLGSAPKDAKDILQAPDISQDQRDQAAVRLIAWHDPAMQPVVVNLLTTGTTPVKVALSHALASVGWPEADFIQPLISLLRGRDPIAAGAAAMALSQYRDNPQVLAELIVQAKSNQAEARQPVIRTLGTFSDISAAKTLIYLLEHDDSDAIREAACDALIEMTGFTDLDHDVTQWDQWWMKNGNLTNDQFRNAIIYGRGQMFENQIARQHTLQSATHDFLQADFWNAAPEKRGAILLSYLRSPAPEIRVLGAELVFASASSATATGAPPGSIEQTRLLLTDPSPEVRGAAATALSADFNSAADLVAQLSREQDDFVRVRLIKSLGPFKDIHAIEQMLKWVGPTASDSVRIAAADGIHEGSDIINKDPAMKKRVIDALTAALQGTDVPGQQRVRTAIAESLASMRDDSLADTFRKLLARDEPLGVRAAALVGLGNLPNSAPYASQIATHLSDEDVQMRLAAIQALRQPSSFPLPIESISRLLSLMNDDNNDRVRAAAWDELQHWANLPDMDESGLSALAEGLKSQPTRELIIRKRLIDRLAQDIKTGAAGASGHPTGQELAEQQQTVGDLLMSPAINDPLEAARQYKAAFDYWSSNQGGSGVIDRLCGDIVDAYLAAKHWEDAATFAAGVVKKYGNDPNLMVTSQTVARSFINATSNLAESNDPGAYNDAISLLDAVQKMDPPLPPDFPEQLMNRRKIIEAKHAASSKPSP